MCGICGFVSLRGEPVDLVVGRRMMDRLRHRGPDGEGHYVGPTVFLGHRRLKIIDLSEAARQPLSNEDGTVWVILNGEIYNYREIRQHLEQQGHTFHSHSDTEVIVHAYETFGAPEFIRRLDGMFAFALWDARRTRLILARDRSGKKPLYYTRDGGRFTFASEIKALIACPWVCRSVNPFRIPEFLIHGYVPTPGTMFEGIFQLPPASSLIVDGDRSSDPAPYWRLAFSDGSVRVSEQEAAARIRELLTEAVARRLVSDVPIGALLSGGLDSSIVVGLMAKMLTDPVRTFSIGFEDEASFDERPYAALVARQFGTAHTEFVVRPDAAALLEQLLWHHDQPYGDSSAIPTYLVCKLARQHVTVGLNGDGGDEVFAGYDRFLAALTAARIPGFLSLFGLAASQLLPRHEGYFSLRRRLERFFEAAGASIEERYFGWVAHFSPSSVATVLGGDLRAYLDGDSLRKSYVTALSQAEGLPLLQRLLCLNFLTYLPDDLHIKMDRMSMAHGLETRSPMLDTALVEFVAALPSNFKIRLGQMKYILRLAFKDLIPPAILKRKKHGFGVPLNRWFRKDLRVMVEDLVLPSSARLRTYLNPEPIQRLVDQHMAGVANNGSRLWLLLNFELWLRMIERGSAWTPAEPDLVANSAR